eukprot:11332080-Alexandrium_andersonii.AAC.1
MVAKKVSPKGKKGHPKIKAAKRTKTAFASSKSSDPLPSVSPGRFSVGSICSGLHTDLYALQSLLGEKFASMVDVAFSCDISPHARHFGEVNWPGIRHIFKDVQSPDFRSTAPK